jgi:hypothetical protein
MELSWRDGVTTVVAAGIALLYAAFLAGADLPVVSGPRLLGLAALLAGVVMCAVGARVVRPEDRARGVRGVAPDEGWFAVMAALGTVVLLSAVVLFVSGLGIALAVQVATTLLMWLLVTARRVFAPRGSRHHRSGVAPR